MTAIGSAGADSAKRPGNPAEESFPLLPDPDAAWAAADPWASIESLVRGLCTLRIPDLDGDTALHALEQTHRLEAWAAALKARLIDRIHTTALDSVPPDMKAAEELAHIDAVTETACALRLPERTTQALFHHSHDLTHNFPATLNALTNGTIDYPKALTILNEAAGLPPQDLPRYETELLATAADQTRPRLAARARRLRETLHPAATAVRRTLAEADRALTLDPAPDGMAWLNAYLPAETAHAIYNTATSTARTLQHPTEPRTLTQLRADTFAAAALGHTGPGATNTTGAASTTATGTGGKPTTAAAGIPRPAAQILVTVPLFTLLGLDETPADLDGYGPIPADTARTLAAEAPTLTRLITHPVTGALLTPDRTRYTVTTGIRTYLQVRDGTCRFPGCNRQARYTDLDHTQPWARGGKTNPNNLAHLCPRHHRLKHQTAWQLTHPANGTLHWLSPKKRTYTTQPQPPPTPTWPFTA